MKTMGRSTRATPEKSPFYSSKTHIPLGEIDYVKTYQDDYKNKAIHDWFAGSCVVREKETPPPL
jgi:hypothetical protein